MARHEIRALRHGGRMAGRPLIGVVHSAETPLRTGYAVSLARNWFAARRADGRPAAKTSAHVMVDPRDVVTMVPDTHVAYHCGNGNRRSKGYEQAGYARFTRAQWTTEAGMKQMHLLAAEIARDAVRYGWPLRWATDQQIRDAHAGRAAAGLATHDDMRRVLGGTTHTDPSHGYPRDLLLQLVQDYADDLATQDGEDVSKLENIEDKVTAVERQVAEVHKMLAALCAPRRPDHSDPDAHHLSLGDLLTEIQKTRQTAAGQQ